MVEDDLIKDKIIDTELSDMEKFDDFEKIEFEEDNSLMSIVGNRSIEDNGGVCYPISNNFFRLPISRSALVSGLSVNGNKNSSEFVLNGTVSSNSDVGITIVSSSNPLILPKGNYTVQIFNSNIIDTSHDRLLIRNLSTNSTVVYSVMSGSSYHFSLTNSSPLTFNFIVQNGSSYSNTSIRIMINSGNIPLEYEPYEGCLYGLELYDMIEPNFMTNNYYINCGIIFVFLALIILIINTPFIFIRKIKGN